MAHATPGLTAEVGDLFRTVGPRTIAAAVTAKLLGRPTPLQVVYEVTHLCNLACEYCDRHTPLPHELPLSDVVRLIHEFADLGMIGMTLDGGDPLARPDVDAIVDELASRRIRIVINTNGSLIPRRIETVAKAAVVNVSLDGPERCHDAMRGTGAFRKAIRGIRIAREAGVAVKLRCTVHRDNIASVPELLEIAASLDAPIAFQPVLNSLFLDTVRDGRRWELDPAVFRRLVLWLAARKKTDRYIANHYASLKHFLAFPDRREPPCSGGWIHATMDPEGYLYHCGQVNRSSQRINAAALGAREAFQRIARYGCGECWCASLVETNYIWGVKLGMFTPAGMPPASPPGSAGSPR